MADYVKVAEVKDVPPGSMHVVELSGKPVVLANVGGQLYAFDGTCTHRGGPLGEGELQGNVVVCPWHAGQFNVRTGQVEGPPPAAPVATYQVQVEGSEIKVASA